MARKHFRLVTSAATDLATILELTLELDRACPARSAFVDSSFFRHLSFVIRFSVAANSALRCGRQG